MSVTEATPEPSSILPRPATNQVDFDSILAELKELPQWVLWRYIQRSGKWTKVPCQTNGWNADATDPDTWTSFAAARSAYNDGGYDGIGFVVSPDDPYTFIDLDHVISKGGVVEPWAAEYVRRFESYAELSPSETGIHIFVRANLNGLVGRKKAAKQVEMYDSGRFATFTGNLYGGVPKPIQEKNFEAREMHREVFGKADEGVADPNFSYTPSHEPLTPEEQSTLEMMFSFGNLNDCYRDLYENGFVPGKYREFPTQSEAEYHFCKEAGIWFDYEAVTVDRVARNAAFFRPKWDEYRGKKPYGLKTIGKAFNGRRPGYADELAREAEAAAKASRLDAAQTDTLESESGKTPGIKFRTFWGPNAEEVQPIDYLVEDPFYLPLEPV